MTREEAANILEYPVYKWSLNWDDREDGLSYCDAIRMAIDALRIQQKPMRMDTIQWSEDCSFFQMANAHPEYLQKHPEKSFQYYPYCGRPLTDKATKETERRIGGNDETTD